MRKSPADPFTSKKFMKFTTGKSFKSSRPSEWLVASSMAEEPWPNKLQRGQDPSSPSSPSFPPYLLPPCIIPRNHPLALDKTRPYLPAPPPRPLHRTRAMTTQASMHDTRLGAAGAGGKKERFRAGRMHMFQTYLRLRITIKQSVMITHVISPLVDG